MALLTTIALILGLWCAAALVTVALYAALRTLYVRRQRARVPLRPRSPGAARASGEHAGRTSRQRRRVRHRSVRR